ncbi:MAG: tyrosine-type recombinase/integrase [Acidobacteriaceae bacterium]|nr:tyrosine-type recombinase/integrase [Acidobacteriaceae bacterium]
MSLRNDKTPNWLYWTLKEEQNQLPRKRFQQTGSLFVERGRWFLRYYKDEISKDGALERVRKREELGPDTLTEKQAQRKAADILSKNDSRETQPLSRMSFADYFAGPYMASLAKKSKAHREQAEYSMSHILPVLGSLPLSDITRKQVQRFIDAKSAQGYSPETVRHFRKFISGVYAHASDNDINVANPTRRLDMPEPQKVNPHQALTFEHVAFVISKLPERLSLMSALSVCDTLNVAELTALRWRRVNLTEAIVSTDGFHLPPKSLLVWENYSKGEIRLNKTKTKSRQRILPIPDALCSRLEIYRGASRFNGRDDLVFCTKNGTPIDYRLANRRQFKKLSKAIEVHFSWHSFRHTAASLLLLVGADRFERKILMGHSTNSDITDVYSHALWDRLRTLVNAIAGKVLVELTEPLMPAVVNGFTLIAGGRGGRDFGPKLDPLRTKPNIK